MNLYWRCLLLVAVSAMAALAQGLLLDAPSGEPVDDGWAVELREALALEQPIWVDSRSAEQFEEDHYPQAFHLGFDDWDSGLGVLLMEWEPERAIVVYCDGNGCESSRAVAARLREELGVTSVFWLRGGWPSLQEGAHRE